MADEPKKSCERVDELHLGPAVSDDTRLFTRHTSDHRQVVGVMRRVREGEPLTGNVFSVEAKDPANGIYKVTDIPISGGRGKPAQVSTDEFRTGWENTFGVKQPVGQA
jgi:hypothetical protein